MTHRNIVMVDESDIDKARECDGERSVLEIKHIHVLFGCMLDCFSCSVVI